MVSRSGFGLRQFLILERHEQQDSISSINSFGSLSSSLIQLVPKHFAYHQQLLAHVLHSYIPVDLQTMNAHRSSAPLEYFEQ